ncbi:hypothetical protein N7510_008449 [Penicillium lagena]|uniref:uncharacterized protein n=1 Tax=Penicillium lagena TaxID=94218 RepID=UPI00253F7085|nr:uncharacterized protein N7510_008449 [Penicillium lagena]KAJ5605668.1 hypothetical protein N7510_008449 [Penicillium lagena]
MFAWNIGWHQHFSDFPGLDAMEFHLLEHYIHRFSRTYPAFPGPDNSFLSVFVPLAAKSSLVLHSLLALSGIQGLDQSNVEVKAKTLRIRQRALVGCRQLVTRSASVSSHRPLDNMSEDDLLYLLASCMLLLLYEKLTGEGQANWQPHFQFIREVVACYQSRFMKPSSSRMTGTFCFLHSLFAYHDLLRAMQLRTKVFSTFYENSGGLLLNFCYQRGWSLISVGERDSKFYYPRLMVRICAADVTVTEADIYSWDGNMSWLPSFPLGRSIDCHSRISGTAGDNSSDWLRRDETRSLIHTGSKKVDNLSMLSDLYRITAFLLHKQIWDAQHLESGNPRSLMACDVQNQLLQRSELAAQGISLIQELLQGLSFKSTLLWPIGIIMRDLIPEQVAERECLIACLDSLSEYFHMKHFTCLRASLELSWSQAAHGQGRSDQSVGFNTSTTGDTMLLG